MNQLSKLLRVLVRVGLILGILIFWAASPPITSILASSNIALKEFVQSQQSQIVGLDSHHRAELKELKSSQETRRKEWEKTEREARHKFFEAHEQGPERRAYIQEFFQRREAFKKNLIEERSKRARQQDVEMNALRYEHAVKLKKFKEALDIGKSSDTTLWPVQSKK